MTDQLLLKPSQAAAALAISRSTLYLLIKDGTIPSVKIGNARRISTAALEDYARKLSETAA